MILFKQSVPSNLVDEHFLARLVAFEISGTNERICLVKGKIASVLKVSDVILEKIREKVDSNTPTDIFDHKGMERKNEVRRIEIWSFELHFITFCDNLTKKVQFTILHGLLRF